MRDYQTTLLTTTALLLTAFTLQAGSKSSHRGPDPITENPFQESELTAQAAIDQDYSDVQTIAFQDKVNGFEIRLPDSWELEEGFSDDYLDFVIVGVSPEEGPNDNFIENMNVLVEEIGDAVTLEEYFMWNLVGLVEELPNFKMHEKVNVEVNGIKMARVVYSWDLDHQNTATYQYIFVKGSKGYVITFSADPKKFQQMRRTFDAVATSFNFSAEIKQ